MATYDASQFPNLAMIPTKDTIILFLQERKGKVTLGEMAEELLHMFSVAKSYSQMVSDQNEWFEDEEGRKVCPLCKQTCYWAKLTFKKRYVSAMKVLYDEDQALTFKEIAESSANNETYFRYFTEARHWGFLEGTGEIRIRAEAFRLTDLGRKFLLGMVAADSFILKLKGSDQTKRDGDADPMFVDEIYEDNPDELCDAQLHMENAKAAI